MSSNAISFNALTFNGLAGSELEPGCESTSLQVHQYLVECALASGQSIAVRVGGETRVLDGALGLAPGWLDGPCDGDCQGRVSACLIARTNARGERVEISLRGAGLEVSADETEAFPDHEGSYDGDVFAGELFAMACLGDGVDQLDRTCGELDDCPIAVQGSCFELCDETGCRDARGDVHHAIAVYRAR